MKWSFLRKWVSPVLFPQVNLFKLFLNPIAVKYKLEKYMGEFENVSAKDRVFLFRCVYVEYVDFCVVFTLSPDDIQSPWFSAVGGRRMHCSNLFSSISSLYLLDACSNTYATTKPDFPQKKMSPDTDKYFLRVTTHPPPPPLETTDFIWLLLRHFF